MEARALANNNSYEVLLERLGYAGSERLRAILEEMMTPDQALMVTFLPGTRRT